jgi:hypothetical protein
MFRLFAYKYQWAIGISFSRSQSDPIKTTPTVATKDSATKSHFLPIVIAFEGRSVDVVAVVVGDQILWKAVVEVPELLWARELQGGPQLQRVPVNRIFY